MMVDEEKLLEYLAAKQAQYKHLRLVGAVLGGLATAVKRGDLNTEESKKR